MSNAEFRVPTTSLTEIEKIIAGYARLGSNVSLDDICGVTGMGRTHLSPNHPFLLEVGLIEGKRTKSVTELGSRLGYAIQHNQQDDIRTTWKEVIERSELLKRLVDMVHIRGGVSVEDFISRTLFIAKQDDNKGNKAGARAIKEILVKSGILEEDNDHLSVVIQTKLDEPELEDPKTPPINSEDEIGPTPPVDMPSKDSGIVQSTRGPSLHIDIQIHISPDSTPEQIDHIFASMAKHLYPNMNSNEK